MLQCEDYEYFRSNHHSGVDLTTPVVIAADENAANSTTWKETFKSELKAKIISQLGKVFNESNDSEEILDGTLRLKVHFGHFYLVGAFAHFKGQASNISLQTLDDALENRFKGRKSLAKEEFDDRSLPSPYDVAASAGVGSAPFEGGNSPSHSLSADDKASKLKALNCGYWNSIISPHLGKDFSNHSKVLKALRKIFLEEMGFHENTQRATADADALCALTQRSEYTRMKVEIVHSPSYAVHCMFDETMTKILSIEERPTVLVKATLLSGNNSVQSVGVRSEQASSSSSVNVSSSCSSNGILLGTHDIRFRIDLHKNVKEDSLLFEKSAPKREPVIRMSANGDPEHNPNIPAEYRDKVPYARRVKERRVYRKTMSTGIICESGEALDYEVAAVVAEGVHYNGKTFELKQPFVELSLEVDTRAIVKLLKHEIAGSDFVLWINHVFETTMQISDVISSFKG